MVYREFTVDSTPPRIRLVLADKPIHPGDVIDLKVDADPDTRIITARLASLAPASVRWDGEARINRGKIVVPATWPEGEYTLRIIAEDFAHNITSMQTTVRIGG